MAKQEAPVSSGAEASTGDIVAYLGLVGTSLALLVGGLVPIWIGKGSTEIHEHNKIVLVTETIGVAALAVFGVYKFGKALKPGG